MEHEFPYVEVEMKIGGAKLERKLKVSEFVEKEGAELKLKNREKLQKIWKKLWKRFKLPAALEQALSESSGL